MNVHAKPAKPSKKVAAPLALRAKSAAKSAPAAKKPAARDKRPTGMSEAEWQARVDLAAVYRLCAHNEWDDLIYNHCSMRVPGEPNMLLMKQHELLWDEVTASNLKKVDMTLDLDERAGVNRPGFTLHGGLLGGRSDINCVIHVHTELGMAMAGVKG
jgi:ribulose-5-phosphate 4-epimerase/fuculose-1-phosphate aldolase